MRSRRAALLSLLLVSACASARTPAPPSGWAEVDADAPYPLDDESRALTKKGQCPPVQLIRYAGDVIPYHKPLQVNAFFRERLQQFELVVREVAIEVYGRPPARIIHYGAYLCRRIAGRNKMSEHGLGNALDVGGFAFDADPSVPGPLGEAFQVSLKQHWRSRTGFEANHSRFLRQLANALAARPDIFRGMLGPGDPAHEDHFHFDVGVWRYMRMGE